MANPFDQFDAPTETNQTVTGGATANPFDQFDSQSPDGGLQDDLNAQRDAQVNAPDPVVDHYQADPNAPESYNNMYGPILSDPKYKELEDAHHSIIEGSIRNLGSVGIDFGGGLGIPPVNATVDVGNSIANTLGYKDPASILNPDYQHEGGGDFSPTLQGQRDAELQQKYENSGQEQKVQPTVNLPTGVALNTSFPYVHETGSQNFTLPEAVSPTVRTQTVNERSSESGYDNGRIGMEQGMAPHTYMVDPPTRDAAQRMGYQMLKNIAGGLTDASTEGKLLTAGTTSKSLPDQVQSGPESLATAIGTLVAGPQIVGKGYRTAVEGLSKFGPTGVAAAKIAGSLSPSAIQESQQMYKEARALSETVGAKNAAIVASNLSTKFTKVLVAGAGIMATEAAVAPDGMQGGLPVIGRYTSPQALRDRYPSLSEERAKDLSFMLDTPIIAGTLRSVGAAIRGGGAITNKALGGLRDFRVGGKPLGTFIPGMKMGEQEVGERFFTAVDPDLVSMPTEQAATNIKLLGDLIARKGSKDLLVAGVKKSIQLDTAAAFADTAEDYVKGAYSYRKDLMDAREPGSFDKWVKFKSDEVANRMFEMRTTLANDGIAKQGINDVNDTLTGASNRIAGGDLKDAQSNLGNTANQVQSNYFDSLDSDLVAAKTQRDADVSMQLDPALDHAHAKAIQDTDAAHQKFNDSTAQAEANRTAAESRLELAKIEADNAKKALENPISNDSVLGSIVKKAQEVNPLGSKTAELNRVEQMSEPTYQSYKNLTGEKDKAYQAIADAGADGDPNSILQIIKDNSPVDAKGNPIVEGVLKKVAESVTKDGSFGNIYNKVRQMVQENITSTPSPLNDTLRKIRSNINKDQLDALEKNGDSDVVDLVQNAKQKYNDIVTTFGDNQASRNVEDAALDRLHKEKFSAGQGPGQGVNDFKNTFQSQVSQNLDAADQGRFLESISKGVKLGGNNIDSHIADTLTAKSLDNLAQKLSTGGKEDINTLRSSLSNTITGLEKFNPSSPLLKEYKRVAANIETLQNVASTKNEVLESAKEGFASTKYAVKNDINSAKDQLANSKVSIKDQLGQTQKTIAESKAAQDIKLASIKDDITKLKAKADSSLLNKFIYDGEFGKRGKNPGEVHNTIESILNDKQESTSKLQDLWKKADELGSQGDVIKDAIKGTTIAHIRDGMKSGANIGVVDAAGNSIQVNRQNITKAQKFFDGKDLDNLEVVFKDEPEVIEQLAEAKDIMKNLSIKTPVKFGEQNDLTRVTKTHDPVQAMGTAITLVFGVLNSTASKLRRFTAPAGEDSLKAVKEARKGEIEKLMSDPAHVGRTASSISDNMLGIHPFGWSTPFRNTARVANESIRPTLREGSDLYSKWQNGTETHKKRSLKEEMDSVLKDK